MKKQVLVFGLLGLLVLFSCEKKDPDDMDSGYKGGILITNEGAFGSSNGSVSFFSPDSSKIENNIFLLNNNRPLGDVVQSLTIHNEKVYIVVNNSQKVEVTDLETFTSLGVIEGLSYPRYFLGVSENKGYITNGSMAGYVYVVELSGYTITDSIQVGNGPEQLVMHEGLVYVANSGGWISDNTISVINPENDEVTSTINVGDNPAALAIDRNNDLWVLCKGKVVYDANWAIVEETESQLNKINLSNNEVEVSFSIGQIGDYFSPGKISLDPGLNNLFFIEADGIYKMNIDETSQPSSPLIGGSFYGLGVDPDSGSIYALSSGDFSSPGYVFRYDANGESIDSFEAGIAPNGLVFN